MMWPFDPLVPLSYEVIVADPPWRFRTWGEHNQAKSASRHYCLMTLPEIKALPVGNLAQADCLLLLWTTGWAMATGQAHDVVRAWGFDPKSEIVWNKRTSTGKTRMGTGYWARSMHEPIMIASIGKPRKFSAFPSAFDGVAREHSRKPDEFYGLVNKHTAGLRRADLFSRESRAGFDGWGNEHGKFDRHPLAPERNVGLVEASGEHGAHGRDVVGCDRRDCGPAFGAPDPEAVN